MNKPIWRELAPEIECVTHRQRFPVDGGTCAVCIADDIAAVEPLTVRPRRRSSELSSE